MIKTFFLTNIISLIQATTFPTLPSIINYIPSDEKYILEKNEIHSWNDYYSYMIDNSLYAQSGNDGTTVSSAIIDVEEFLNKEYSEYLWHINEDISKTLLMFLILNLLKC